MSPHTPPKGAGETGRQGTRLNSLRREYSRSSGHRVSPVVPSRPLPRRHGRLPAPVPASVTALRPLCQGGSPQQPPSHNKTVSAPSSAHSRSRRPLSIRHILFTSRGGGAMTREAEEEPRLSLLPPPPSFSFSSRVIGSYIGRGASGGVRLPFVKEQKGLLVRKLRKT